jgi:hypothetical protein
VITRRISNKEFPISKGIKLRNIVGQASLYSESLCPSCTQGHTRSRIREACPTMILFEIRHSRESRSGSALIMVLGVVMLLAILITAFGYQLRGDLRATGSFYDEAQNRQLARSALILANLEASRANASLYADQFGNACFVLNEEDHDAEIEELLLYRSGWDLGRGRFSYRLLVKLYALDLNELSQAEWARLFEVACGMDEGDDRDTLIDAILDWRDGDDLPRELGAEEDSYQELDPPRHVRNADFETVEELLLVEGMTPELLFGTEHPVYLEDGMLFGGGLYRFLIGDNSPEAEASVNYIQRGIIPSEEEGADEESDDEEGVFQKIETLPPVIYLVAEGFVPELADEETSPSLADYAEDRPPESAAFISRHIILAKLVLVEENNTAEYSIDYFQENAAGELLEQILAYGVPEE